LSRANFNFNDRVVECFEENEGIPSRLSQDDDVLYAFEKKRRQEMRSLMKMPAKYSSRQPPRVRRKSKGSTKLRPIKGVLKKTNRGSKSFSRSRGRSASKDRSFSRGRSNSRGREIMDLEGYDTLSIAELSNMGDCRALSYVSEKLDNQFDVFDANFDAVSITSNTDTLIVGDLIDIDETSRMGSAKKKKVFNSAKIPRKQRSRSRSKDIFSGSKKRKQGGLLNSTLFRERSSSKKHLKKNRLLFNPLETIGLNDLQDGMGKQGMLRALRKERKALNNKRLKF